MIETAFDKNDDSGRGLLDRGMAYGNIGDFEVALSLLSRAEERDHSLALPVLLVRGNLYASQDQWDAGVELADQILTKDPNNLEALHLKKKCLYYLADSPAEVETTRRILELAPDVEMHSRLLFTLLYVPWSTPESIYDESRRWFSRYGENLQSQIRPHENSPDPQRKLRIGYLSPDLRNHAIMKLLPPVLEHHNESEFEAWVYSIGAEKDSVTDDLATKLRRFVPLDLDTHRIAERVRADGIDILWI